MFLFRLKVRRVGLGRCVFGIVRSLLLGIVLIGGLSTECSGRKGRF